MDLTELKFNRFTESERYVIQQLSNVKKIKCKLYPNYDFYVNDNKIIFDVDANVQVINYSDYLYDSLTDMLGFHKHKFVYKWIILIHSIDVMKLKTYDSLDLSRRWKNVQATF